MLHRRARRSSYRIPYHRHFVGSVGLGLTVVTITVIALSTLDPPVVDAGSAPAAADVAELAPSEADPLATVALPPLEPVVRITKGQIEPGRSLASALADQGAPSEVVSLIALEMSGHFDFRYAQPGHSYRLTQDESGQVLEFRYRTSDTGSFRLTREGEGYAVRIDEAVLRPQTARIAGIVTTNLHDALQELGESSQLAGDFADIFAWDIDFSRNVHPGDAFRIVYERLHRTDDEGSSVYVRPGRILAALYSGTAGKHIALYFEDEQGRGSYYRPDGTSVQRQFLVAPLRFSRISSSFTASRLHPILRITRPHHGIDYAAPDGTPVWAVADGKVIFRGAAGGFGNLLKIRHAQGYVSYYAHLSRFVSRLRVGQEVEQKQLIGYVGDTGLTTGPHVCFRIARDGRYVNPTRVGEPGGDPVAPSSRYAFYRTRDALLSDLVGGSLLAATQEAL